MVGRARGELLSLQARLGVEQRVLGVQIRRLGEGRVDRAGPDRGQFVRDAVVGDDGDVAAGPGRFEELLLLQQGQRRLQEDAAGLQVDAVDVLVLGEQALELGGGHLALPVGGQLVHGDLRELLLHAGRERRRPVAPVDGAEVALEFGDPALAAQLLAEVFAGLLAVGTVVGAYDHVDLALVGAGVHAHHRDLLLLQALQLGGDGAGVLRGHHDRLGSLVGQRLHIGDDLGDVVLRIGQRQRGRPAVLQALLDVPLVGVPEVGVRTRHIEADLAARGVTAPVAAGERGAGEQDGAGRRAGRTQSHGWSLGRGVREGWGGADGAPLRGPAAGAGPAFRRRRQVRFR